MKRVIDNGTSIDQILSMLILDVCVTCSLWATKPSPQPTAQTQGHGPGGGGGDEVEESRQPIKNMINIHAADAGGELFLSPFPQTLERVVTAVPWEARFREVNMIQYCSFISLMKVITARWRDGRRGVHLPPA